RSSDLDRCIDAGALQIGDVGVDDARHSLLIEQELDTHLLALIVNQAIAGDCPDGLAKKRQRLLDLAAHIARSVRLRGRELLREQCRRQDVPIRFEKRKLLRARKPRRLQVGVLKHRAKALIKAMKEILVGPFEIKKQPERLARLDVVEWRAAGVEEKRLHSGQAGIGKNIALDEAVFDRRL